MTIEDNVSNRKYAQTAFDLMLHVARDDYLKMPIEVRLLFIEIAYEHFAKKLGKFQPDNVPPTQDTKPAIKRDKRVLSAINDIESLISMCDEIPEAGADFADSVSEVAGDMLTSIEQNNAVTDKQLEAIENWIGGVERWLR